MKTVCMRTRVALALMAALVFTSAAQAQVLKQVPKDASFVFKINDLQAMSGKLKDMAARLGVADLLAGAGAGEQLVVNPLGLLKDQLHVKAGLKDNGEFAVAFFMPAGAGQPTMLALVPVSDYAAFIGNFGDPAKEGDVDVLKTPVPVPVYAMKCGRHQHKGASWPGARAASRRGVRQTHERQLRVAICERQGAAPADSATDPAGQADV